MAINQSILQPWLAANPSTTADAAGVAAAQTAHQVYVNDPISLIGCMEACSIDAATQARLEGHQNFGMINGDFESQDRETLLAWLPGLMEIPPGGTVAYINSTQAGAIQTYLSARQTDPAWANLAPDDITTGKVANALVETTMTQQAQVESGRTAALQVIAAAAQSGTAATWSQVVAAFQAQGS